MRVSEEIVPRIQVGRFILKNNKRRKNKIGNHQTGGKGVRSGKKTEWVKGREKKTRNLGYQKNLS